MALLANNVLDMAGCGCWEVKPGEEEEEVEGASEVVLVPHPAP